MFLIWTCITCCLVNPFRNKPWFLRVYCTSHMKTLWEKEKLLAMSNFSFSHSVFYLFEDLSAVFIKSEIVACKLFQFGRVHNLSFGKGLRLNELQSVYSPLPNNPVLIPLTLSQTTKFTLFQN